MHHRNLLSTVRACLLIAPLVLCLSGTLEAKSIGKDQVNIRSNPNTKSKILFSAPLGYPISIEKESKDWVFFTDGKTIRAGSTSRWFPTSIPLSFWSTRRMCAANRP